MTKSALSSKPINGAKTLHLTGSM